VRRLRNLIAGLPADARCRRDDPNTPVWGYLEELLAQVIEEVSVLAADRRRKEPRVLPRPGQRKQTVTSNSGGGTTYQGFDAMLGMVKQRMGIPMTTEGTHG
jgi:hypothetical protein